MSMHKTLISASLLLLTLSLSSLTQAQIYYRYDNRDYDNRNNYDDGRNQRYQQPYQTPYQQPYDNRNRNTPNQCQALYEQASRTAARLADYARRLRMCAESSNLRDNCSGEYQRLNHAYSDYDEAVSMVRHQCR